MLSGSEGRDDQSGRPCTVIQVQDRSSGRSLFVTLLLSQVKPFLMAPPRVSAFKPDQLWQQAREPMFWLDPALRVSLGQPRLGRTDGSSGRVGRGPDLCRVRSDRGRRAGRPGRELRPSTGGGRRPARRTLTVILHASGERLWRRVEFWPFRDQQRCSARNTRPGARGRAHRPACPIRRPTSFASASWSCGTGSIRHSASSP